MRGSEPGATLLGYFNNNICVIIPHIDCAFVTTMMSSHKKMESKQITSQTMVNLM